MISLWDDFKTYNTEMHKYTDTQTHNPNIKANHQEAETEESYVQG